MNRRLIALSMIALWMTACGNETLPPTPTLAPIPTPILPTATSTPTLLYTDDFANASTNWTTGDDVEAKVGFENGAFRIFVNFTENLYWSILTGNFTNTRIDVDATKVAGPDTAAYGVICRYTGANNIHSFYYLAIAGNQSASVFRVVNGQQTRLSAPDLRSDSIIGGNASNHITAECVANRLTFYVNGAEIFNGTDDSLVSGNVGLVALTYADAGIDVYFDNFVMVQP